LIRRAAVRSLSKISRPRLAGTLQRKGLFKRLDERLKRPVIWLSGPPGSGKTTLVADYVESTGLPGVWYRLDANDADPATFFHYMALAAKKAAPGKRRPMARLTPEHLMDVPAFTRRYFQDLYSRLKPPFMIVFDDYHNLPAGSELHSLLAIGLSELPPGGSVVIVSRSDPPAAFSRFRADGTMEVVGGDDMLLPLDIDDWPWPIRVYTLGRFSLVLDGEAVRFSGKAQKRPLLMLKALIALGGRGVRAAGLSDALWPEAEGDAAQRAFDTTLHRLRRLLGNDEAVELGDGLVTLNARLVWVDAWAFERMLGQAGRSLKEKKKKAGGRLLDRALSIYQGPFMAGDADLSLYMQMGERLRSKFLRSIGELGRLYEGAGEFERAIDRFKRGIEVDDLAEEFYLGLMLCYKRLGRAAEAMGVYNRLEKTLSTRLEIKPSPASRAVYEDLRKGG